MASATIEDYTNVLSVSSGHRPLSLDLEDINTATVVQAPDAYYLHCGCGQFAVVFRCRTVSGTDVALRCLLLPPSQDAAERAAAVSDYVQQLPRKPESFVGYRFVPDAIYAASEWRAAYVMDWITGNTLSGSVRDLVGKGDAAGLQAMSDNVARMVSQMQEAGIAHGDLHPENIMVLPTGDLRLVDYDSVYVPVLQGRSCPIVGPEGYSQPSYVSQASVRPFNLYMDTFAGLVLITSIRAIANDLSLFQQFTKENLFFTADDLQDPMRSPAFATLLSQGDAKLVALTSSLQEMCLDPEKAQVLLAQVRGIAQERRKAPGPRFTEPVLPKKPVNWKPQPAVAQSTFAAIFHDKA